MPLTLRPARPEDAPLFWEWANDPAVRSQAFTPQAIPLEEHLAWFRSKMAGPDSLLLVVEDDGVPVGQVRFDRRSADEAEIDVSVARAHRGRGVGSQALRLGSARARDHLGVTSLVGVVFEENLTSRAAFRAAGFAETEAQEIRGHRCVVYRLPPPEG